MEPSLESNIDAKRDIGIDHKSRRRPLLQITAEDEETKVAKLKNKYNTVEASNDYIGIQYQNQNDLSAINKVQARRAILRTNI